MSEETPPSDNELTERKESLKHVEIKAAPSERNVVLKCTKCETVQNFPVCDKCGEPMDFEEEKFLCSSCEKEEPIPTHCDENMVPKIV